MKNVIVTGAYGGMGYETVKLLSQSGFTVFALDKTVKATEPGVIPVKVDIGDPESVSKAFDLVSSQVEDIFAIIHFAGIYRLDSLVEMSESRFTEIFNVNLFGAYRVNKTFLPLLKRGGRIIITTSELAELSPMPFTGIYAITKTTLDNYAFSLRMELQLLGVGVSVIRPGAVKTGLLSVSTKELDDFCDNTEIYSCNAERFKKIVNGVESKSIPPKKVAKTALRALSARRPKYVYNLNRNPLLLLYGIMPARLKTAVIRKILKGEGNMPFGNNRIVSFEIITLHTSGMRHVTEYEILMKNGKAEVSEYGLRFTEGEKSRILNKRAECSEVEILKLLNNCKLISWDGFYGKHPKGVLDGTMFTLDATVNGGRTVHATGSQNFPRHYRDFTDGIHNLLENDQ